MVVDAKHGLLQDGWIRVDGKRTRVLRDTGGWYVVRDATSQGDARVLYREGDDLAVIQWRDAILRVPFRGGEGAFTWDDRGYRIGTMIGGEIRIDQGARTVVRGHVTAAGLHLDSVAAELLPILRALVWALVLRVEARVEAA